MGLYDDAIELAGLIAAAENAVGDGDGSEELDALHQALRKGLYRNRAELGLTDEQVSDIDNAGQALRRGGGAKDPMPVE